MSKFTNIHLYLFTKKYQLTVKNSMSNIDLIKQNKVKYNWCKDLNDMITNINMN